MTFGRAGRKKVGLAPLAAVVLGMLAGLTVTMTHVALQWPGRSSNLEPAIPLAVACGAALLLAERFAVSPLAQTVAAASMML